MSPPQAQLRQRPSRTFNYLPSSSYVQAEGLVYDISKDLEQGSTGTPMVWYGTTTNAGKYVRDKARDFFVFDGSLDTFLISGRGNNETRPDEDLDSKLAEIRSLLRAGDTTKAREYFAELPGSAYNDPTVKSLGRAVAHPETKLAKTGSGHRISRNWIRENSDRYQGQWVAVLDNQLLDSDESCISLRERVKGERDNLAGVQFLFVG